MSTDPELTAAAEQVLASIKQPANLPEGKATYEIENGIAYVYTGDFLFAMMPEQIFYGLRKRLKQEQGL